MSLIVRQKNSIKQLKDKIKLINQTNIDFMNLLNKKKMKKNNKIKS